MRDEPVIVIGAGFGGLAAAVRLRAMGHPVTLLEARERAGGRAGVIHRDGHTFDTGPTVITAPQLFDQLFELAGRRMDDHVEMRPVDPFYRVTFPDGSSFDYVGDQRRLRREIARFHPADIPGYRRLADRAEEIFEVGYRRLADEPFDSIFDMLRILPEMIRLGSHRSVYETVAQFIRDERLRRVFTFQPLLVGGNPFRVTSIYLLIHWLERKWGVHYPTGGTAALVDALVELLEKMGVDIRTNTPVDRIEAGPEGVEAVVTEAGRRFGCRFVVSNADPSHTYRDLVDPAERSRLLDERLARINHSMGLFVGFFGTDETYPQIPHHTIVMGQRYRGLLEDIFERKILADDFSVYLHRPTASDPTMAPPGRETFYVLAPVPNNKSGIDWSTIGDDYFDRILAFLEDRHLPGLRDNVCTRAWHSPDYFQHQLRSVAGAGFGPEPRLTQSAWFRFHNRSKHLEGLFFVGAGVHPGAGIPGVLNSAKVLEDVVPRPTEPLVSPPSNLASTPEPTP